MCLSAGGSSHHPHPREKEDKKRRHFPQGNVSPSPACLFQFENSLIQQFLDHGALFEMFHAIFKVATLYGNRWNGLKKLLLEGTCRFVPAKQFSVFISRMMMKMTRRKRTIMPMICWGKELVALPCWQTEPGYLLPLFVNHHIIICFVRTLTFAVI